MLIEIAFAQDESFYIMGGHSKIKRRRIAPRFGCAQIARKSAENHPKINEFSQIGT